jgi:hypothetical protein
MGNDVMRAAAALLSFCVMMVALAIIQDIGGKKRG